VVHQFQQMMRDGVLSQGDRLPSERELAEQFNVSRNSVREALRELDLLGLVESRHGEGTFVRRPTPSQLMAPFRAVIELSTPAVDSVLEFRMVFEPGVAALAAANLTELGEGQLREALEAFERAVIDSGPVETVDASCSTGCAAGSAARATNLETGWSAGTAPCSTRSSRVIPSVPAG
jgi:GntR family transcriptional repressor for pyruvate dehydrogenase complex